MLITWEKRAGLHNEDEANDGKDVFEGLLADFWEGLGLILVRYVDSEEADPQTLEGVATLLQVSLVSDSDIFPPGISLLTLRIRRINKTATICLT